MPDIKLRYSYALKLNVYFPNRSCQFDFVETAITYEIQTFLANMGFCKDETASSITTSICNFIGFSLLYLCFYFRLVSKADLLQITYNIYYKYIFIHRTPTHVLSKYGKQVSLGVWLGKECLGSNESIDNLLMFHYKFNAWRDRQRINQQ